MKQDCDENPPKNKNQVFFHFEIPRPVEDLAQSRGSEKLHWIAQVEKEEIILNIP